MPKLVISVTITVPHRHAYSEFLLRKSSLPRHDYNPPHPDYVAYNRRCPYFGRQNSSILIIDSVLNIYIFSSSSYRRVAWIKNNFRLKPTITQEDRKWRHMLAVKRRGQDTCISITGSKSTFCVSAFISAFSDLVRRSLQVQCLKP